MAPKFQPRTEYIYIVTTERRPCNWRLPEEDYEFEPNTITTLGEGAFWSVDEANEYAESVAKELFADFDFNDSGEEDDDLGFCPEWKKRWRVEEDEYSCETWDNEELVVFHGRECFVFADGLGSNYDYPGEDDVYIVTVNRIQLGTKARTAEESSLEPAREKPSKKRRAELPNWISDSDDE